MPQEDSITREQFRRAIYNTHIYVDENEVVAHVVS